MSYLLCETKVKLLWTTLINKSLVLKMNKKLLTDGIYFYQFEPINMNISITFVTTSCKCEEVTFHCRWRISVIVS